MSNSTAMQHGGYALAMEVPVTPPFGPQQASVEEYLRFCQQHEGRFEYRGRRIVPIAAGSLNHGRIADNVCGELRARFVDRPCEVFSGQVGIAIRATGDYLFPDASAVCGEQEVVVLDGIECVANPQLVIEVLSPSTGRRDRYAKFDAYSTIPTLVEYALIDQDEPRVTMLRRMPGGPWIVASAAGLNGVLRFESIDVDLPLNAIYLKVKFVDIEQPAIEALDNENARDH